MPSKTQKQMVEEMYNLLTDFNGRPGLCTQVEKNTKQINKLWIMIAIIVAGGGGGGFAIIKTILGG